MKKIKRSKSQKFDTNIRKYKKINNRAILYSILIAFSLTTN